MGANMKQPRRKSSAVELNAARLAARRAVAELQAMSRTLVIDLTIAHVALMCSADAHSAAGNPSTAHLTRVAAWRLMEALNAFRDVGDGDVDDAITRLGALMTMCGRFERHVEVER
jgi:hypothetical protein